MKIEEADEGELIVLRRALSGQKASNHKEQRENIFHTRCTINGRVCSLMVDRGSCANVASITLFDKLLLNTEPHPQPYPIQWLNQGKGLKVSTRCLISFSIGENYMDELWSDIIPMDAYHVLLGRPLLYDRKVTYDGFLNTYSLHKNGRKITLVPLLHIKFLSPSPLDHSKMEKSYFPSLIQCSRSSKGSSRPLSN